MSPYSGSLCRRRRILRQAPGVLRGLGQNLRAMLRQAHTDKACLCVPTVWNSFRDRAGARSGSEFHQVTGHYLGSGPLPETRDGRSACRCCSPSGNARADRGCGQRDHRDCPPGQATGALGSAARFMYCSRGSGRPARLNASGTETVSGVAGTMSRMAGAITG